MDQRTIGGVIDAKKEGGPAEPSLPVPLTPTMRRNLCDCPARAARGPDSRCGAEEAPSSPSRLLPPPTVGEGFLWVGYFLPALSFMQSAAVLAPGPCVAFAHFSASVRPLSVGAAVCAVVV